MRKLTLSILAASIALIPAAALAEQHRGGGGHGGGGHGGGGHRGGGFFGGGFFGGGFWGGGGGGGTTVVVIGGDGRVTHPGRNWDRRLRRGGYVHPYWWGSQFYIDDWRRYGFADPGPDHRWIRYYDDAYMIDRRGRVVDGRDDFEWGRYRDEWEMDDGVPHHRRRHGGHHDEEEYSWFEREDGYAGHGGGWDMGGYGEGGTVVHGGPAYGPGPHGGYGYGYGYYAYPIVIETTTTYGQSYSEEVVEEYVEVRRPRRRVRSCQCARPRAPAPRRPAPRPRPPAGERG